MQRDGKTMQIFLVRNWDAGRSNLRVRRKKKDLDKRKKRSISKKQTPKKEKKITQSLQEKCSKSAIVILKVKMLKKINNYAIIATIKPAQRPESLMTKVNYGNHKPNKAKSLLTNTTE